MEQVLADIFDINLSVMFGTVILLNAIILPALKSWGLISNRYIVLLAAVFGMFVGAIFEILFNNHLGVSSTKFIFQCIFRGAILYAPVAVYLHQFFKTTILGKVTDKAKKGLSHI